MRGIHKCTPGQGIQRSVLKIQAIDFKTIPPRTPETLRVFMYPNQAGIPTQDGRGIPPDSAINEAVDNPSRQFILRPPENCDAM
ncbi:unnamed protein product [Darwinula stevensoni]|uniref:Uncharacterized protein n=1 Tax=Darwinula stevensoni TaxID=69355 RepID=A0A7R9A6Z0_9CRUS|nr:unnamed protein product [Darwinula stevensoni]CAG0896086.1 unnamed protein product [Darwinula stevensoni]